MEHKDRGFVGKHYLIKQAFGQEELHQREAVCTREDPPGCSAADYLRLWGKRRFWKSRRGHSRSYSFSPSSGKGLPRDVPRGLRLVTGRRRDPDEGSGKSLRFVWRK